MIEPVFKRSDFTLCDVPVPKGYPQSQTHVGVKVKSDLMYLTSSPYPNPQRSTLQVYLFAIIKKLTLGMVNFLYVGEDYENPCLYIEKQRDKNDIPFQFEMIKGSPLMDKPLDRYGLGSYCSDPDLYIEGDYFYVLNRTSIRKKKEGKPEERYETSVFLIRGRVVDGIFDDKETTLLFKEQDASPCLIKKGESYYYLSLDTDSYNTGTECRALFCRKSAAIDKGWSEKHEVILRKGEYEPWHMSVFSVEGKFYSVIACVKRGEKKRCWQMLGEFDDNFTTLTIYQTPLTDFKSYRGSAIVTEQGDFLFYNTTVNESIKDSKSVDGRDVVVAKKDFKKVLSLLREGEK